MFDPQSPQCWKVYDFFMSQRARLREPEFLREFLTPHCKFKKLEMRGSRLRIIQVPDELARFLIFMADQGINSYLEIGTSTGGSWMLVDSYLRAVNPNFDRSVGYDRKFKLRDWEEYRARFPACEFRLQNSAAMDLGDERFDMAFIDARHEETWVWNDFTKVRNNVKFAAFHDIVLGGGATVDKFWKVARTQFPSWEFIDETLPMTCGIGVLQLS